MSGPNAGVGPGSPQVDGLRSGILLLDIAAGRGAKSDNLLHKFLNFIRKKGHFCHYVL